MNSFQSFFIRSFAAVPTAFVTGLVSFAAIDVSLLPAMVIGLAGGGVTYAGLGAAMTSSFLKKNHLTRKEYKYIKKNLAEADKKISRLNKQLFTIRDLSSVKQRIDILRVTKKIHKLATKEPKRFYQAEPFYFSHLDSVVELTEKYNFLSAQPKKNMEMNQSLIETRQTLNDLTKVLADDLYKVVSDDIDNLHFEIDVAKHTINKLPKGK